MSIMRCIILAMTGVALTAAVASAQQAAAAGVSTPVVNTTGQPASNEATLLLNRAVMLYGERSYSQCEPVLTRLLELEPGNGLARFMRAMCYGQMCYDETAPPQPEAIAELFSKMQKDLDLLVQQGLPNREAIVLLLDAVASVKLAGLSGEPGSTQTRSLLEDARQLLERYLERVDEQGQISVTGLDRVRGRFFLGVVLYRLGAPIVRGEQEGERREEPGDLASLKKAYDVLAVMVDPAAKDYVPTLLANASESEKFVGPTWMGYAEFYLGLIAVLEANQEEVERARELYVTADGHLAKAKELSADNPVIQEPADRLSKAIKEELAKPPPKRGAAAPVEDFRIDLQMGLVYDSNVILLGDSTTTPRDIGRSSDGRFESAIGLNYTLDLAKINSGLKGTTIALSGRAASSWNFDISSYNEQDYGGSVAIQQQLGDTWTWAGAQQGPLYATVQYDYDYFLLGNKGFLSNNRVTPRLALFSFDQRGLTTLGFRYEDRDYFEDLTDKRFERDGNYFAFFVNQSYDCVDSTALFRQWGWEPWGAANDPQPGQPDDQRWLRPYIGTEYGWDSTVGDEYDKKYMLLAAGIEVPLPYGLLFDFRGEWDWGNYGGTRGGSLIDFHRRGRDDLEQRYRFGLERRFVLVPGVPENRRTIKMDRLVMTVRADIQYTDEDSNVEDRARQKVFSYDRGIYGVSVQLSFN